MTTNIFKLEKKLNLIIKNKDLFIKALTHKSSSLLINNEKLEFLGDRVIGLLLSKKLFDLYPNENEGILDKRLAKLVNKNTCAKVFQTIGINDLIILGSSYRKLKKNIDKKILSDTCEAIVGAIFLEYGYQYVEKYVLKLWKKEIHKSNITIIDPKTRLQEHSLKLYKTLPFYRDESLRGPKHSPIFKVSVKIKTSRKFTGEGNSKKAAQQNAAQKLLMSVGIK